MTKINWYNGKTANSASDMQKLCDAINRSLSVPVSAPADTKVVAVDNTNTQKMLTIGDGLSIENDTLKASASGGNKLYQHNIVITHYTNYVINTTIITKNSNIFNETSLGNYLRETYGEGFNSPGVQLNGGFTNSELNIPYELYVDTVISMRYVIKEISIDGTNITITGRKGSMNIAGDSFIDTVIEL